MYIQCINPSDTEDKYFQKNLLEIYLDAYSNGFSMWKINTGPIIVVNFQIFRSYHVCPVHNHE